MAWIRINLPFTKWANPFTPCRFVVKWFAWSSGTCGKLYSPCWNSFWGQALTETFQGTILGFGTRPEGELKPEDSLKSCLSEVEAEVGLQIILEPDCTTVVLVNLELLELHQPPLLWLLIELPYHWKKGKSIQ